MDYQAALEYFRDRSDYDRGFISNPFAGDDSASAGLTRTRRLLDVLGSPDRAYPILHVAGTKGKGSTCAFIESVARESGCSTGLFTTPHLHTVRERIQVRGEVISESAWTSVTTTVADAVVDLESRHPELGRITAFEINTAMALEQFKISAVDLGIVEVGLGGRLDATNVVMPVVSVITPISFDHQAILGQTIAEIASEKAGIIKPGVPVVIAPQKPDALSTILQAAVNNDAPTFAAGCAWTFSYDDGRASLDGPWSTYSDVELGLAGAHQAQNAGTALMALWTVRPEIFSDREAVRRGLENTCWPGRYEIVSRAPRVIVDGAHNGASVGVLVETLVNDPATASVVVMFGSYADKDVEQMMAELAPLDPVLIATRSSSPRALASATVAGFARLAGFTTFEASTIREAIESAMMHSKTDTTIVATGSLSIVAGVREHFGLAAVSALERRALAG